MKFIANTKTLKTLMELHKKVCTSKSLVSALSGVMFEAKKDNIKLYSTNLESSLITEIKADVINTGKCLIPGKIVENVINCNEADNTEFELLESKKIITSSRYSEIKATGGDGKEYSTIDFNNEIIEEKEIIEYHCKVDKMKLNIFEITEFPEFPIIDYNNANILKKLDADSFITSLDKVIRFASHKESKVILTGILFDTANNTMVGTDSYRLGTSFYCFGQDIGNLVIPYKVLEILKAIQKKLKANRFDIIAEKNQIAFVIKSDNINITLISRLLSGKFPEYKHLIPTDFKYQYEINPEALIKVIDKANKLLTDNIPIKFNFNTVKADIIAEVKEIGTFEDEIKVNSIKKDDRELFIAFNPDFLKDGLKEFVGSVNFYAEESLKPVLLKNTDDFKYVLMPIRV